jgi:hypothetical protein
MNDLFAEAPLEATVVATSGARLVHWERSVSRAPW